MARLLDLATVKKCLNVEFSFDGHFTICFWDESHAKAFIDLIGAGPTNLYESAVRNSERVTIKLSKKISHAATRDDSSQLAFVFQDKDSAKEWLDHMPLWRSHAESSKLLFRRKWTETDLDRELKCTTSNTVAQARATANDAETPAKAPAVIQAHQKSQPGKPKRSKHKTVFDNLKEGLKNTLKGGDEH
jgi:hypothetical protein